MSIKGEPTNGDFARGGRANDVWVSGDVELIDALLRAADAVYDVTCAVCGCSYGHKEGCRNENLAAELRELAQAVYDHLGKKGDPPNQQ